MFSLKEAVSPQECPSDSLKLTAALRHLESEVRAYWIMQWQTVDPQVAPLSFGYDPSRRVLVEVRLLLCDLARTDEVV